MDNDMIKLEHKLNANLTERERMIFKYAYESGKNHEAMFGGKQSKVVKVETFRLGSSMSQNFLNNVRKLAKMFDVEVNYNFTGSEYGLIENAVFYKITARGKEQDIDNFFKAI